MKLTSPYPGLRPFERHEDILFFGRDEQVDQLLDKLADTHFLAVLGTSGSGKSSLVKAGLLPALDSGFMAGAGARWAVAELRPGDKPFIRLSESLVRDTEWGKTCGQSAGGLEKDLRRGSMALNWRLGVQPLPENLRLLILVDQFEELFRYHKAAGAEAAAFVALLLGAAAHPDVYVVITMRSEFLGDCSKYPDLPEAINAGLFLTPSLTPEQMADAVQLPAALPQFEGAADHDLVRRLLNEVKNQTDQLPLLQHALMRMWDRAGEAKGKKRLDADGLNALGGLNGCLNNHVEEAFKELNPEQRRIAEVMFRALTERFEGGRDTRRPAPLGEIAGLAGVKPDAVAAVAEVFRKPGRSFLMPPAGVELTPDTTLDITHEALIRQWKRLRKWTASEAEQAELYLRLEAAARRHDDGKGALWIDPDLEFAIKWRDEHEPGPLWAARYGGNFDLAMDFLDGSRKDRDDRAATEERRRRDEIRRARKIAFAAIMALIITALLAGWAVFERGRTQKVEQARTESLFDSGVTHAALLARVNDPAEAREVLARTAELDASIAAPRRHARNLLAGYIDIMGGTADKVYEGAGAVLNDVAVSPDGRLLAAAGERGTLVLFDAETGELLKRLEGHDGAAGDTGSVRAVHFTPEGDMLYSGGDDGRIIRWSMPEGEKLGEWEAPGAVWAIALSSDGKILASAGEGEGITIWNAERGEKERTLSGESSLISDGNALAFSPDDQYLVSGEYRGDVGVWDMNTGEEQVLPKLHTEQVTAVAVSLEGDYFATGSGDKRIILWNAKNRRPLRMLRGHENMVLGLTFSQDGRRLFSASRDNTMRLWDVETGVPLRIYQGHTAGLWTAARHGDTLYTAANDGTVRRWSAATPGQWVWDMDGEPISAAVAPDGRFVTVGFANGALRVFALPKTNSEEAERKQDSPSLLSEIEDAHNDRVLRIAYNKNADLIATSSHAQTAKIWQINRSENGLSLTLYKTFDKHSNSVHAVAFSPDGRTLATAGYDGKVGLFDVESGEGEFIEPFDGKDVNSVCFAEEGAFLLAQGDWNLALLDISKSPPESQNVAKVQDLILWAALRPDGRQIAAVGRGSNVTLHDLGPDAGPPRKLVGHEQTVFRAIYSPDGTQLATVGGDATVRIWDLTIGKLLFTLRLPTEIYVNGGPSLWDFDFRCTPDGHCWIAVPLTMGRLALYRLPYEEPPESILNGASGD